MLALLLAVLLPPPSPLPVLEPDATGTIVLPAPAGAAGNPFRSRLRAAQAPARVLAVGAEVVAPAAGDSSIVIDGRVRGAGDDCGGWTVEAIGADAVSLRGPRARLKLQPGSAVTLKEAP